MVQTPQFFDRQLLEKVHRLAAEQAYHSTDDAALVEWQGYPVKVLEGSYENIKVTTPEDLLLAEAILKKRGGLLP
jgi:2-C-methyl-D-erythritol 4-phosphate cytidylyltransferase